MLTQTLFNKKKKTEWKRYFNAYYVYKTSCIQFDWSSRLFMRSEQKIERKSKTEEPIYMQWWPGKIYKIVGKEKIYCE